MQPISLSVQARDGSARTGILRTPHGDIETPAFVPVGTKASIKGVMPDEVKKLGAQVVLGNTYHLYLQPGEDVVKGAGGLGKFMNWTGPTMTDSGGFQVFSLGVAFGKTITKITTEEKDRDTKGVSMYDEDAQSQHGQLAIVDDEGVTFTSHHDGSLHRFTPERSVEIQHALGADMFFAFDEFKSPLAPYEEQKESMYRTHRWAERSLYTHRQNLEANKKQGLFGIIQGGRYEELRKESAEAISSMGFDGFGIGGTFSKADLASALVSAIEVLPEDKPRHLLGIGEPGDVLTGIQQGIDLFDCVAPTRLGRHGTIYTPHGTINLTNEKYRSDFTPLSPDSPYTRAYVRHLLCSGEMLGQTLASIHNLAFIISLVDGARAAIREGRFDAYHTSFIESYYGRI